jgi:peptide/nickel transport system permease protein
MRRFIIRRLLIAIPILFGVSLVTFTFANLAPGDPVSALIKPGMILRSNDLAALKAELGLDRPWIERYLAWIGLQPIVASFTGATPVPGLLEGNLGTSFVTGESIAKTLGDRIPNTLKLMGTALLLSLVLGVLLGVFSAFKQGTKIDTVLTVFVFAGISLPSYLIALLVVVGLAVLPYSLTGIKFFPATGIQDPLSTAPPLLDFLYHLALPALVLAFGGTATFLRYTRASVLEVMRQDHVTTARSKGLGERRVRYLHILRNALLPVVTVLGLSLPSLITGAIFVETLFVWPGVGSLAIQATLQRDYPMILAIALLTAITVIIANLLADIAYAYVDPRIRYS